jgi:hypothetical protein
MTSVSTTTVTTTTSGECVSKNPCQQLCFDLHDGTFECACRDQFFLSENGYSCIRNGEEDIAAAAAVADNSQSNQRHSHHHSRHPSSHSADQNGISDVHDHHVSHLHQSSLSASAPDPSSSLLSPSEADMTGTINLDEAASDYDKQDAAKSDPSTDKKDDLPQAHDHHAAHRHHDQDEDHPGPGSFFDSAELNSDEDMDLEQFNSANNKLLHHHKSLPERRHQTSSGNDDSESGSGSQSSYSSSTSPPSASTSSSSLASLSDFLTDPSNSDADPLAKKFEDQVAAAAKAEADSKLKNTPSAASSSSSSPSSSGSAGTRSGFHFNSCHEIECEAGGTCVVDAVTPADDRVQDKISGGGIRSEMHLDPALDSGNDGSDDRLMNQMMPAVASALYSHSMMSDSPDAPESASSSSSSSSQMSTSVISSHETSGSNDVPSPKVRCRCPLGRKGFFCEKRKPISSFSSRSLSFPLLRSSSSSFAFTVVIVLLVIQFLHKSSSYPSLLCLIRSFPSFS